MDYTTVIVAGPAIRPRCNTWPRTPAAMAEYFMYKGQDALIVYDDSRSRPRPTGRFRS